MSYGRSNLLADGAVKDYRLVPGNEWPGTKEPGNWTQRAACTPGKTYTLSIVTDVEGEVCFGFYLADGSCVRPNGYEEFNAGKYVVRTLTAPEGAEYVAASWEDGNRRPMVVEGTEPAAWAPADGETLAGGGAQMSANLWKAESVISSETQEGGIYACSGTRGVRTNVALDRLAENQTFHCGFSVNPGKDDTFGMTLCYRDAAGNFNYAFIPAASAPAGKWTRVSGSVVVPSDMTVYQMVICNDSDASGTSGWKVTNPTLSLGSPVTLASDAHTPYATQDHVAAEYATKAALKVTSDAVTAELNGMRDTVALTEDAGAASRNYAVGEFFYDASHNLCRVTQAVSQGASLVSGTNYTTVSGGVQQYIGTPTYVYATAPSEETVKAARATPCFVYAVDTASFYYVS